jgi:hypothetical protein
VAGLRAALSISMPQLILDATEPVDVAGCIGWKATLQRCGQLCKNGGLPQPPASAGASWSGRGGSQSLWVLRQGLARPHLLAAQLFGWYGASGGSRCSVVQRPSSDRSGWQPSCAVGGLVKVALYCLVRSQISMFLRPAQRYHPGSPFIH